MIYDFNSVKQVAQYFTVVFVAIVPFDMGSVSTNQTQINKTMVVFFFFVSFFFSE